MDKEKQREQAKLRMRRKRNKERNKIQEDVTQGGENVTQIRPIILALADPVKREKLRRICASLEKHNVLDKEIYYGLRDPCLLSDVNELLTAF